jgi:hypothetical protein
VDQDKDHQQYLDCREQATKALGSEWADRMNKDYGPFSGEIRGYTPEDMLDKEVEGQNRAPLATDLVTFVIWLRKHTDFFSGPELNLHYPEATSPEFLEVLALNALIYTGE